MALRRDQRRITDEDRSAVRALHAEGLGRNEIARRIGRGSRTVSVLAAELGLSFDRTHTAIATEARVIDAKARRAALVQRAYTRAEKIYDRLEADAGPVGYDFTATSVNGIETKNLNHVPAQDERALALAAGAHLAQAAKLEALDGDPGLDAARSMLGGLAEGLRRIAEAPEDTGEG
ncbi:MULTISPECIES: helix-turn-helix domain-containing protein [Streptomyces]|uniref:Helix-turn-helix domain-containing protein n=1 Tax=Streptomyces evansiae TaxID=3075535 RepID=A0ABU2R1G5_9ACTN|nr:MULTISPECIES: helix-turn-helix domain-containing protein [unclassified Streptomyces]MDT0409939.1 helix-turn-helix domain-containing protein [Streptomyces sp. DSM 41979]MYQ59973.1 helix-turn-helix domain-containing protein [Streptomyces sp. SID4926]SCE40700.1 hypothetical protein GA0115252_146452 [Streptomyces sp. DfronAA-171]